MHKLFIQYYVEVEKDLFYMPLESLIIIFIYTYLKDNVDVYLIQSENKSGDISSFLVNFTGIKYKIIFYSDLIDIVQTCDFPSILTKGKTVISGLCSVARKMIQCTIKNNIDHHSKHLLGFRDACLMACNEVSVWTKFCEIDLLKTVEQFLISSYIQNNSNDKFVIDIPIDVARYEQHLKQPIRIHNVYKIARQQLVKQNNSENIHVLKDLSLSNEINKTLISKDTKHKKIKNVISTSTPVEHLNLGHLYAEGPFMTLADLILFPQVYLIFKKIGMEAFKEQVPLIYNWLELMGNNSLISISKNVIKLNEGYSLSLKNVRYILPLAENQSLYKSDPKRYKPQNRLFTKQDDIDSSLKIIEPILNEIEIIKELFGSELHIDWSKIPLEASPLGGALPKSRAERKCEQLENLAKAVLKLSRPGDKIVDFCSGSGHLGILLAILLPKCTIVLLENKEESLRRARKRVKTLELENVSILQCNLDFFKGSFDIGVSLHACGVATDLVIEKCLRNQACFVCCPCCYGGVHNCHHLEYPRSNIFKQSGLSLRNYLVLGHSADQTHDEENVKTKQGVRCMDIIDMDRMLYAQEYGYEVKLGKLNPPSCSPKNNLLVGWLRKDCL